jgi:tRNA A-37 threonylcarbamoyl transferase component Bud32
MIEQQASSGFLRRLAGLLDIRLLVVLVGLWIILVPAQPGSVSESIDRRLFALANLLQQPTIDGSAYIRVNVSAAEMRAFMRDPAGSAGVSALLEALAPGFVRGVAFVLPDALPERTQTEELLSVDWYGRLSVTDPVIDEHLKKIQSRWKILDAALVNSKYLFAVRQTTTADMENYSGIAALRKLMVLDSKPELPAGFPLLSRATPAGINAGLSHALLWRTEDGLKPDALLELYMRQQGLQQVDFSGGRYIRLNDKVDIPVSSEAVIYPRLSADGLDRAGMLQINLSSLLQQNVKRAVHDKYVVVGQEGDPATEQMLTGLLSLTQGYHASITPEYRLVNLVVIAALMLFLMLLPLMSVRLGVFVFIFSMGALIVSPVAAVIGKGWWFPAGQWICFWLTFFPVMLFWVLKQGYYDVQRDWFHFLRRKTEESVSIRAVPSGEPRTKKPAFFRRRALVHEQDEAMDTQSTEAETIFAARTVVEKNTKTLNAGMRLPDHSHHTLRPTIRKIGKYDVRTELGRGAMGIVYKAFDSSLHRDVAIKTLQYAQFEPDELVMMKDRFFGEAKAAGKLKHPNIVTIHDMGELRDMAYIVMDYVAGKTLASYVSRGNLLDVETVYWIIAELADALDYAHAVGLVHRDVKPSNILYDEATQEIKIADFGIAKELYNSMNRTRTGEVLGSPLYMSPEQVRGEKVSGQSDLFSLGVTFYQLLTGDLPFKADNIAALTRIILACKYTPVDEIRPDLPASAKKISSKALQKHLDARYANGSEMAMALDQARERDFRR